MPGNAGNNILNGGAGNDTLNGASGSDTLKAATGNDTIIIDLTGGNTDIANAGGDAGDKLVLVGNVLLKPINVDLSQSRPADFRRAGFSPASTISTRVPSSLFGLSNSNSFYGNGNNNASWERTRAIV